MVENAFFCCCFCGVVIIFLKKFGPGVDDDSKIYMGVGETYQKAGLNNLWVLFLKIKK